MRQNRDKYVAQRAEGANNQDSSAGSVSSASIINYWKHWVVMQGSDQVAADDVREGKIRRRRLGRRRGGRVLDEDSLLEYPGAVGLEKRQEVRKLVGFQSPFLLCIQETKLQSCDVAICSSLWGNSPHAFSYRPSVGASRGLLILWDSSEVEVWASESHEHVLWCHGRFIKSGQEFSVANVYGPCDPGRIKSCGTRSLCGFRLWGDQGPRTLDHVVFNLFIDDTTMINLSLCGRKYTWFKGDGLSMSRLDRFLLIGEWCLTWPNCTQGPRPSRMLKCWKEVPGYNTFVQDTWNSFQVDGWGGGKEDLVDGELVELHKITTDIHSLSRLQASIRWQQSRSRWLKEGDANTKYFHSVLASRQWGNAITSLQVGSSTVEGVAHIRHAVVSHFASHFKAVSMERLGVDNLIFKQLTPVEGNSLIKPFSLEDVKAVVRDCDSFKSLGPDGVNFGFIKDFWMERQGDIMPFIVEPISLVCNLYKILAKVLANRLHLVMGSVISNSQTSFVKDRQILDGILIANEVVDEARRAKKELLMFKVDFEKAYDSVDSGYLDVVIREWVSQLFGGNGLKNVFVRLQHLEDQTAGDFNTAQAHKQETLQNLTQDKIEYNKYT
ncbi:hypothetical protein TSUD_143240 [Trifolium subterraneum]|uniref:Reverse transcriptase domain-containing protein n=1 Tax=Trifolium subterraneum TaxID=3900 RepID=A0A2Z6PAN8_TRISU|nr:hypothetical protein TSUD_143240 [Trifolium subterraneum]